MSPRPTRALHMAPLFLLLLGGCDDNPDSVLLLDPARVEVVSGDGQAGPVGTELPEPLVIRVLDEDGAPVVGIEVTWTAQDGSVEPEFGSTDADGRSSTMWTLGQSPGEQLALAAVTRAPQLSVHFTATAEEAGS